MQLKRRQKGLENGTYVRFPDPEAGPFILKKSVLEKAEQQDPATVARIRAAGEAQLAALRSADATAKELQREEK